MDFSAPRSSGSPEHGRFVDPMAPFVGFSVPISNWADSGLSSTSSKSAPPGRPFFFSKEALPSFPPQPARASMPPASRRPLRVATGISRISASTKPWRPIFPTTGPTTSPSSSLSICLVRPATTPPSSFPETSISASSIATSGSLSAWGFSSYLLPSPWGSGRHAVSRTRSPRSGVSSTASGTFASSMKTLTFVQEFERSPSFPTRSER